MKKILSALIILTSFNTFAQKPCEIDREFTDSLGSYTSLKQQLVFERSFAGNSTRIYFTLSTNNGILSLETETLQQSNDFIKANCFDKNSKLFLQLNNGKIITLLHIDQENCGTMIRDDKGYDNRVITGEFMFMKDSFEQLKSSPISMMRIKYLTDTEDYVLKKEFTSELNNEIYQPETYFINTIKCIE